MAAPKYPLQTKFWKSFGQYGIFLGTIVGYDLEDGMYKCYYEEDGDEENLTEDEIEMWLKRYPSVANINQGATKKKRTTEQPNKERAKKPTPEQKQSSKVPPKFLAGKEENSAHEKKWKQCFQKLKAFREANGHTRVPGGWPQDPRLANWVKTQRNIFKDGTFPPHRQTLLEQEGFEFGPIERSWGESYQLLADHKKKFGGFSNITRGGPNNSLYNWIGKQKSKYREGHLTADRKKLLDKLGLNPKRQPRTFEENFHLLLEFQKIHGHTNVPAGHQDTKLARFVYSKRSQYRTNQIPKHQREELEKIGFHFRLREKPRTFEENYEVLLKFKKEFGHAHVPSICQWDQTLAHWVVNVRSRNSKLNGTQKKKLGDIGFEWRRQRTWQESFNTLVSYKRKHGNCDVPYRYKDDTALGFWVSRHRQPKFYKALDPERKDQLKAIGFHPHQEESKPTSILESNPKARHVTKSKKRKAATSSKNNHTTKSNRAAKQTARQKIENQVDQESSNDEATSGVDSYVSYDSDQSIASEESTNTTRDDTVSPSIGDDVTSPAPIAIGNHNQPDRPEEVISTETKAEERRSASEVSPDKAESSKSSAFCVAPDVARSSGPTHGRTRAKAAVPETAKSKPHGEPDAIVPDLTKSRATSAPRRRTSSRRGQRKSQQQEEQESSIKKPRWLFDG